MNFFQFLDKNSVALIPIFGTILGIFISQLFTWLNKNSDWKNQVKLKKLENSMEFEKQHLITPIREFLETDLIYIQKIFFEQNKDYKKIIVGDLVNYEHMKKVTLISAKVNAFKNIDITKKFDDYVSIRMNIIQSKDSDEVTSHIIRSRDLASEIFHMFKSVENNQ